VLLVTLASKVRLAYAASLVVLEPPARKAHPELLACRAQLVWASQEIKVLLALLQWALLVLKAQPERLAFRASKGRRVPLERKALPEHKETKASRVIKAIKV
jgi:hypothetical protein